MEALEEQHKLRRHTYRIQSLMNLKSLLILFVLNTMPSSISISFTVVIFFIGFELSIICIFVTNYRM